MQAELARLCEYVYKLKLFEETFASHRIEQLHNLRLLEMSVAWRKTIILIGEIYAWRGSAGLGGVYLINHPKHCDPEVEFQPQLPPAPQEHTDILWADVN